MNINSENLELSEEHNNNKNSASKLFLLVI